MKNVRSQGGKEGFDQCGQGGVFRYGCPHFLEKKLRIFQKLWCVRTDKERGGVDPVRTFFGQGRWGQFFTILCGRLSWTVPNLFYNQPGSMMVNFVKKLSQKKKRLEMTYALKRELPHYIKRQLFEGLIVRIFI